MKGPVHDARGSRRARFSAGADTTTYKAKLAIDRNDYGVGDGSIAAKLSSKDNVKIKLLILTFQRTHRQKSTRHEGG